MAAKTVDFPATTDAEIFYTTWQPKLKLLAMRRNFGFEEAEDIGHDTCTFLITHGYLERFDPSRGTPFRTYIFGQAYMHMTEILSKRAQLRSREHAEETILDGDTSHTIEAPEDAIARIEIADALALTLSKLREFPTTKTRDLAKLFVDLIKQAEKLGEQNATEIAKEYGYSRQGVQQQIAALIATEPMRELYALLKKKDAKDAGDN